MLEIGNRGMKPDEYRTQMSLWSILAAPLIAGNDLRRMDEDTRAILLNREVIAVDQDGLGRQGERVRTEGPLELWAKPLESGARAIAIFNRGRSAMELQFSLNEVGFSGPVRVRDLWLHQDLGIQSGELTVRVPKHGVAMWLVSKPN